MGGKLAQGHAFYQEDSRLVFKSQSFGIDAISFMIRIRPIVEEMAEMRFTRAAENFSPFFTKTIVFFVFDIIFRYCLGITRPSGMRIVFIFRTKKRLTTCSALINPFLFEIVVFSTKGRLCAFIPEYMVLLGRESFLPLSFWQEMFFSQTYLFLLLRAVRTFLVLLTLDLRAGKGRAFQSTANHNAATPMMTYTTLVTADNI